MDSYGRPGFGSICRQLAQAWKEKPKDVEKSADSFLYALQKTEKITTPSKLERTIVLLRMFCVGSYPSSQMYSSFALSIMGIEGCVMSTVYYTIAQ